MKNTSQNYKSAIKPVWCPGCGNYAILKSLQKALSELEIEPENIVTVSGIGCSGRFSHYMNTYSLHGTHGRAVPTALGAKAARPDLTVLCVGGDGDGLGIGGGHIPHAARKNVDLTYILIDNRIYGLTKGQSSPTTPIDKRTKTSPYGVYEEPLNAIAMLLAYDTSFIARISSLQMKEMVEILKEAINHKGFSVINVMSPCVTFPVLGYDTVRDLIKPIPENHDPSDKLKAMQLAYDDTKLYTGIFYKVQKPTLEDNLNKQIEDAVSVEDNQKVTVEELLEKYV
ncbi:2-oxoacid:ferredoxin oxidoreductase subunit beta [candidate division KSB1 bacterium]|nr:MAG: 2-oxoacid:ferredoxin oxidoreductase subunit beta [candidate division KSB1 bacterium]